MIHFNRDYEEMFYGVLRKYMQLRGGLSQKDLAELTDTGISTMSRFLNQKVKDLDEQLIAKIVAKLNIPIHEVVDFVQEESTERFKKLVAFYKEERPEPSEPSGGPTGTAQREATAKIKIGGQTTNIVFGAEKEKAQDMTLRDKLDRLTPRQKGYMTDFLDCDGEGKDLIVDIGNALFRYFKQRGLEL